MPLMGLAIAAAAGLAKDQLVDKPADARKRKLAAETQRYSPWTGLKADPVNDSNTLGTMMTAGATGAQIGAGVKANEANVKFQNAMTNRLNTGGSIGGGWGGGYGKDLTQNSLGGDDYAEKLGKKPSWGFDPNF